MKRRDWVIGGVAVAAAAVGAGVALRRFSATAEPLPADFWSLEFERPAGGALALQAMRGKPLLLNFWATWCPPCVTEMPLLDQFQTQQTAQGWQVVGLAVDSPTPVREFLRARPVGFAIGLAGLSGVELARSLGNQNGGLPFTVVIDRAGQPVHRKLGALKPADLEGWARGVT